MRKLCVFSFSFALAVFICQYFLPLGMMPIAAGAALAAAAVTAVFLRGKRRIAAMLIGAGLAAGFLYDFGYDTLVFSHALELDGQELTFEAVASDFPVETDYGAYVDIKIDVLEGPDLKGRAYVFDEDISALRPGDRVRMTSKLERADRIGDREFSGYTSKGYFLFAFDAGDIELKSSPGMGITNFHRYLAKAIKDRIREIFPLGTGDFMLALLTGDRTGIDGDVRLDTAMERAGVSHIVAISGLHVSILAGALLTVLGRRRWAVLAAMPVLALFMAVSGFSPSVVRAVIMQTFVLTAPLIMRESDSMTSLAAALLVLLLINPYAIAGAGLQLSFAATLGMILFTPGMNAFFTKRLPKEKKPWVGAARWASGALSATFGALLLTTPISAYYFGCVSVIASAANVLVLWAVTPAFITGALAVGAGFIWLPLGRALAWVPALAVKYVVWAVELLARPFLAAVYLDGAAVVIWFAVTYLAVIIIAAAKAEAKWIFGVACLSVTSLCVIFVAKDALGSARDGYTLTCLDVGQGQGIVVMSGEYTAVIDCGSNSGEDAGELMERYIRSAGRGRIDALILTHYHEDHANGVERLIYDMNVGTLIVPEPRFTESDMDEEIIAAAESRGCDIMYVEDMTTAALGDTSVTLYPPLGGGDENERGLMALVASGGFETLVTGDAPGTLERQLIAKYDVGDIECLVVGHHGSRTSTSEELLDAVKPEAAIISVGENSYGHPTPEVLERLSDRGIEILRTDESGNIKVGSR